MARPQSIILGDAPPVPKAPASAIAILAKPRKREAVKPPKKRAAKTVA